MKVLVTGGCGFIGSHLAARLVEQGRQVSVLDDLSTGRVENPFSWTLDPECHMLTRGNRILSQFAGRSVEIGSPMRLECAAAWSRDQS